MVTEIRTVVALDWGRLRENYKRHKKTFGCKKYVAYLDVIMVS